MIIEKALDKAKKTDNKLNFQLKTENSKKTSVNSLTPETQRSKKSRIVDIDQEFICSQGCLSKHSDSIKIESYKILRTRLYQCMTEKNWKSLMITSAYDAEGKTLTAINLAFSFSKHYNQTVLLVD